jgi:ribosomal protein S18 acetylase RimI-like enzyme
MDPTPEPGTLDTDRIVVRIMREPDLESIVRIDAAAAGRRRPEYFGLMLRRSVSASDLQVSLVAELDGRPAGFVIGSLYYGEFGVVEPAATIDAIGVDPAARGRRVGKALMRQFRLNVGALGIATIRTEVSWDDLDLLAFFRSEGFAPAGRLCLERRVDPTEAAV